MAMNMTRVDDPEAADVPDLSLVSDLARAHHDASTAPKGPPARTRLDHFYKRVLITSDLISGALALILIRLISGGQLLQWDLFTAVLVVVLAQLLGRYDGHNAVIHRSVLNEIPSLIILAAIWALTWSLLSIPLAVHTGVGRGGTGLLWLILSGLLIVTRSAAHAVATNLMGPERILIVGGNLARQALAHSLSTDPGAHIDIVGYLPLEDERRVGGRAPGAEGSERRGVIYTFDDLELVVSQLRVERVLLIPTAADSDLTLAAVQRVSNLNVRVSLLPRLFEFVGSAVEFDDVGGMTVLGLRRPGLSRSSTAMKRAVDIIAAGAVLAVVSPLCLLTAIAVKLDSPGPVLFSQTRVGRRGEHFGILKFRSMVNGAEAQRHALETRNETAGLFKLADDPRITRVGRLIRRASLDELPQLINVLRGDMSLVGPRPLIVSEDALVVGRYRDRLSMPPGMTGPWQVLGPIRPPLSEMVKTDYLYAVNWSLWLDIKILLRTVSHIRAGHGR
jgi:exopolysaccharide biosynthesis polyprenyl glycosylphosphotransferase